MGWGRSFGVVMGTLVVGLALLGCGSAAPADTPAGGCACPMGTGGDTGASENANTDTGADDTDYLTLVDPNEVDADAGGDTGNSGKDVVTGTPEDPVDPADPPGAVDGVADAAADETDGKDDPSSSGGATIVIDGSSGGDVGDAVAIDEGASAAQVLAALGALPPLPKRHHYAPSVIAFLPEWRDITREIVRITRSSGIAGGYGEYGTRLAVQAAIDANAAEPAALPAVLSMYWGPWLVEYQQQPFAVTDFGAQHQSGVDRLQQFLTNQRAWIDQANADFGSSIAVGHFALEIEIWPIPVGGDPVFEAALLRRHNECYDMVKAVFPEASITWFDRGGVHRGSRPNGLTAYGETRRFTHLERGDNCSTHLYSLMDNQDAMIEAVRLTIQNVNNFYGSEVPIVPFVAVGSGYGFTMASPKLMPWQRTRDYEPVHSYRFGMFVNRPEYASVSEVNYTGIDWNRVTAVFFYPELVDHKPTTSQVLNIRLKHFIAYCCGATNTPFPMALWPNTQ